MMMSFSAHRGTDWSPKSDKQADDETWKKKHNMVHVARYGQGRAEQGGHGRVDGVKGDSLIRFRGVGKVRGQQGQ